MQIFDSRWEFIAPYVDGKKVLDVGPAELVGTLNRDKLDGWLHHRVSEAAARLVGVEQSAEQVGALSALGYELRQGDAETLDLGERFDVVLAGELIEHLSNPGRFLERAREHLADGGRLVLTTPNRYAIRSVLQVARTGRVPRYTKPLAKHVFYFDADSLGSLLERHGFRSVEIGYCKWVGPPSGRRPVRWLTEATARLRPALLSTLVAIAER